MCERSPKLMALQSVFPSSMPAKLRCTYRSPSNTVSGVVKAPERPRQSTNALQEPILRDFDLIKNDLARHLGAQREFAFNFRC